MISAVQYGACGVCSRYDHGVTGHNMGGGEIVQVGLYVKV